MLNSSRSQIRFRLVPFTLMIIAALLLTKLGSSRSILPGLSFSGATASPLLARMSKPADDTAIAPAAFFDAELGQPATSSEGVAPRSNDPVMESRLLEHLQVRSQAMDLRESALDTRETLLRATEAELLRQVAGLEAREDRLALLSKRIEAQTAQDLDAIVKAYERMKPRDAARIFEILEDDLLVSVATGMRTLSLAGVMAQMSPERAKTLTMLLAESRRAPEKTTQ